MNNMKIVFVYENIVIGGVQTLLFRLSRALMRNGILVEVYCKNICSEGESEFHKNSIGLFRYEGSLPKEVIKAGKLKNDISIIVFEVEMYWRLIEAVHRMQSISKVYLYSVHPYTFDYYFGGVGHQKKIINKLFEKDCSRFVKNGVINGHIFFMDEESLAHTNCENDVGIKKEDFDKFILRLLINNGDTRTIAKSDQLDSINLLAVSRADFPFKGYLKGLIDVYSEAKLKIRNLKLTIISSGPHVSTLQEWIREKEEKGVKDILLYLDVPYSELDKFYDNADIYVGMGTTILEAASKGVIAIPVAPYTYACNSKGLFSTNPKWVLTEVGEGISINDLLYDLIYMQAYQRKEISVASQQAINDLYGEKVVIDKLLRFIEMSSYEDQYDDFPILYLLLKRCKKVINNLGANISSLFYS